MILGNRFSFHDKIFIIIALLSNLAKQERVRISERVKAGLGKSRQVGRIGGSPTLDETKIQKIRKRKDSGMIIEPRASFWCINLVNLAGAALACVLLKWMNRFSAREILFLQNMIIRGNIIPVTIN